MRRRTAAILALPLMLATILTGCGGAGDDGGGVATAGGPAATAATGTSGGGLTAQERALKFSQCMRDHGIDVPDPGGDTGEGVTFRFDQNEDPKKVDAAMKACKQYLPDGGEPPKLDAGQIEKMRQLSRCMRENGVPDFPDPDENGLIRVEPGKGVDPSSPKMRDAHDKCKHLEPAPPGSNEKPAR